MENNEVSRYILTHDNIKSLYMVFIVSASVFLDVWDLTAFSFVLTFFKDTFLPSGILLGLSVAGANIGAIIGAIFGGYLTDYLGRKKMLIYNMLVFIIFAILIAVSTNLVEFIAFRIIMGFSIGADVATGFSYIYEYISMKQRNKFYSLWAYAFSVVALVAVLTVYLLYTYINSNIIWRYIFIMGGVFAAIILVLRTYLMETPLWLYYSGKNTDAEKVIKNVYGDDIKIKSTEKLHRSLKDIIKFYRSGINREIIFTYSLNCIVGFIGWGFSFYVTYMLVILRIYAFTYILGIDGLIYAAGFAGALISPFVSSRFGIYKSSVIPSSFAGLLLFMLFIVFSGRLYNILIVPFTMGIIFLDYMGPMAYNAVLNSFVPSKIRGIANGQNYMVNKIVEAVSGFTSGILLVYLGLGYNTLVLALIVTVLIVIAIITGKTGHFMDKNAGYN